MLSSSLVEDFVLSLLEEDVVLELACRGGDGHPRLVLARFAVQEAQGAAQMDIAPRPCLAGEWEAGVAGAAASSAPFNPFQELCILYFLVLL